MSWVLSYKCLSKAGANEQRQKDDAYENIETSTHTNINTEMLDYSSFNRIYSEVPDISALLENFFLS